MKMVKLTFPSRRPPLVHRKTMRRTKKKMNTDNREQRGKEKWVGLEKKMKGTDDGDKVGATVAHGRRKRKEHRRREGSEAEGVR